MAAAITVFRQTATASQSRTALSEPVASYTSTFTMPVRGIARVWGNGGAVVLTVNGVNANQDPVTWTVPSGAVEYFGFFAGQVVTVA